MGHNPTAHLTNSPLMLALPGSQIDRRAPCAPDLPADHAPCTSNAAGGGVGGGGGGGGGGGDGGEPCHLPLDPKKNMLHL